MTLEDVVLWGTLACLGYLLLVYAVYALFVVFAALDNSIRSREVRAEDLELLEGSRFTIPVSVVVPVHDEERVLPFVLDSMLALRYPELEVVIVNDGSTDGTLALLAEQLELEPLTRYERTVVATQPVRATYRSRRHPHVFVVDKENGGKADALNCGLNHARYRYVCCVDGDTLYRPDALLRAMRVVVKDPATIVGVTSHVAVASRPEERLLQTSHREHLDTRLLNSFQHIEYLRSFLNNRLAWSQLGFMLCASGAFSIWRRDVLEEVGGFSRDFTCEDIEMTFRVHEKLLRERRPYRIISLPDMVAQTEGPANVRALSAQRARWQRVTMETVWHYRRMLFNRRYGAVGVLGFPVYVLCEVLAPFVEVAALVVLAVAATIGLFDWRIYLLFFVAMAMATAVLTAVAVLMEDISTRAYHLRHLAWVLLLAPLELVLYRPLLVWARLRGTWGFFRGEREWHKFARNPRARPSAG